MNRKSPAIVAGSIPKYRQLLTILRSQILTGALAPGERIPSEEDLVTTYGLSRGTVRQAIAQLESERLIDTEHGVGSFVRALHPNAVPFRFVPPPDEPLAPDESVRYEVDAQEILPAPLDIAERLKLPPGTNIIHIARRKFLREKVLSYSERYLPEDILPSLVHEDLTRIGSIHTLLEAASEYPLLRAELEIEAHAADEEEAVLMRSHPGQAVISVTRMTYTAPNRPAVWYWGLFSNEYKISVNIT